jgi:hypothetical protein
MIFNDKGKGYSESHGAPKDRMSGSNAVARLVAQNLNMSADKTADKAKEYTSGTSTFIVCVTQQTHRLERSGKVKFVTADLPIEQGKDVAS